MDIKSIVVGIVISVTCGFIVNLATPGFSGFLHQNRLKRLEEARNEWLKYQTEPHLYYLWIASCFVLGVSFFLTGITLVSVAIYLRDEAGLPKELAPFLLGMAIGVVLVTLTVMFRLIRDILRGYRIERTVKQIEDKIVRLAASKNR